MGIPRQDREIGPLPPALPGRRLSSRQQRIIVISTLRLGTGILIAMEAALSDVAGPLGPWVLGWLLGSSTCAVVGSYLRVGSRLSPRTGLVGRAVEPVLAAVDLLAFVAVSSTSLGNSGYGPVAVLGLVLLGQAPLAWGVRGAVLVVAPLTAAALAHPAGVFTSDEGRVALVVVIAGATGLGLWLRRLLLSQEAMAEHARATLSVVFDHSPTPAGITGVTGRFLRVNAAMARLCGCDGERLVGRRLLDLVHREDAEALQRVVASVLRGDARAGSPGQAMETRLTCTGSPRWVRLVVGFVPASLGVPAQLVVQADDVDEVRTTTARLEHEATHDPLTGLPNRRSVHRDLELLTAHDEAFPGHGAPSGALVLLDLDGFKAVNDRLGHAAGDEVLVLAARRIEGCLRPGEGAARLSGDELVVLARYVEEVDEALALGERVLSSLVGPAHVGAGEVDLRASAGVALVEHDDDAPSVLRRADDALYRAKRAGGGLLVMADARQRPARSPHLIP